MQIKNNLHNIPFVRFLIPFIIGIVIQMNYPLPLFSIVTSWFIALCVFISIMIYFKRNIRITNQWWSGFALSVFLLFTGLFVTQLHTYTPTKELKLPHTYQVIATISKPPVEKDNSVMAIAYCNELKDSVVQNFNQKILIYFAKDEHSLSLKYGDQLVFKGLISAIKNPNNPQEFDYKKYMQRRNVGLQTYIDSESWKLLASDKGNWLLQIADDIRSALLQKLENEHIMPREKGVIAALTVGYNNDLDEETKRSFSSTGAMHILSVSGLHVGIIVLILKILLKPLYRIRAGKYISVAIQLFVLFMFAAVSGFCPSVNRAVLMFSVLAVGFVFGQRIDVYNLLGLAAFATLLIEPNHLTDVGFQLSYIAVASIVAIYKPIYTLWEAPNVVLDYIWSLVAVSIAAQIGTSPLGMYYFNQFPNWFLLTNIVAIPVSFVVMVVSVFYYTIASLPYISSITAIVLNFSTFCMNYSIALIESFPFSATQNIHLSMSQMWMVYGAIISAFFFIMKRKALYLYGLLLSVLVFIALITYKKYQSVNDSQMVIFNVSKGTAINFMDKKINVLIADSTTLAEPKRIRFAAQNYWIEKAKPVASVFDFSDSVSIEKFERKFSEDVLYQKVGDFAVLSYSGASVLMPLTKKPQKVFAPTPLQIDYLLLHSNTNASIENLLDAFRFKMVIADASNNYKHIEKWRDECLRFDIPFFDIKTQGAYIHTFTKDE